MIDYSKLNNEEINALIDLLWQSQESDIFIRSFVLKNSSDDKNSATFFTSLRELYSPKELRKYNFNQIKFIKKTCSNALLIEIISNNLLLEWIQKRTEFKKNNISDIERIEYFCTKYGISKDFFHQKYSFIFDEKWSKLYLKVFNLINNDFLKIV